MIAGRRYWILIWYGILALGLLGLWASVYWGRRTAWKNLDELLRSIGTITVSAGMLLLLYGSWVWLGTPLLVVALAFFVGAFLAGRRQHPERDRPSQPHERPDLPEEPPGPPIPPAA